MSHKKAFRTRQCRHHQTRAWMLCGLAWLQQQLGCAGLCLVSPGSGSGDRSWSRLCTLSVTIIADIIISAIHHTVTHLPGSRVWPRVSQSLSDTRLVTSLSWPAQSAACAVSSPGSVSPLCRSGSTDRSPPSSVSLTVVTQSWSNLRSRQSDSELTRLTPWLAL